MSFEGIEDIYPLAPAQAGMVFHALADPGDSVYTGQVCFRLKGPVDAELLRETWGRLLARHAVLRTAILWEDLEEPLQVVHQDVDVPWVQFDWSEHSEQEQAESFKRWKTEDAHIGFEITQPPLMRLSFFDLGAGNSWLVWTSHHAIADGWSISKILSDMADIYAGIQKGIESDLPPAFPYNRFIAWLQSRDAASAEAYWRERLAGFTEPLTLLTPRPEGFQAETDTHETATLFLGRELTATLGSFCQDKRISLFTLVQAAWGVLLSRYCERDDVVFGVTSAGRPPELAGIESAVGLFVNTLPVRHQLDPDRSVSDWLRDVQSDAHEFLLHEATPLPRVKEWSEITDGSSLFDTIVVMTNFPKAYAPKTGGPGWSIEDIDVAIHSNYALALVINPGEKLELMLVFDGNVVTGETARQIVADLESLLSTLVQKPQLKLGEIELPAGDRKERLLGEWALGEELDRELEVSERDVLDKWNRLVREQPDAPALVFEEIRLNRLQLHQRAKALASRLQTAGVQPGDRVAICFEPGIEIIESILGVLKSGAAYVPIDPALPARRIGRMLDDSGSCLLVTHSSKESSLHELGTPLLLIDREQEVRANSRPREGADDLAYILFTSGSTGSPKAVAVTRANLDFSTRSRRTAYPSQPGVFLLLSAYFFDSSVAGIFWSLTTGGTLVLTRKRIEQDIDQLASLIEKHRVSHTLCLPGLYRVMLEHLPPASLSSLDTVILAGEVLPPDVVRLHRTLLPSVRLYNEYGPTEATVWCTVFDTSEWSNEGSIPIGRPIPGSAVYILDSQQRLVPAGVAGELCVAGPGVARGYLGLSEATREAFAEISLNGETRRIYRSGDSGRYLSNGTIEYIGRQDAQVKIRGHRIELAEVEAVLLEHASIVDAVALVIRDPSREGSGNQLAAFVQATKPHEQVTQWKAWLRDQLPEYMVPQRITVLEALPRLSNGKVDREALRSLPMEREHVDDKAEGRLDPEWLTTMQAIWKDVLKVDAVSPADNFFELGGDSLQSINVVARAKKQGIELRPSHLFDFPTLFELGVHLQEEALEKQIAGRGSLRSRNVSGTRTPFFMVHGGRRILSELRRVLGDEQPLHVQPAHWDSGDIDRQTTLEQIAGEALANLREIQQEGPYLVGGYSFGAVIAIEMVRQLEASGNEVAMLFMLDPPEMTWLYRSLPQAPEPIANTSPSHRPSLRKKLEYYRERLPDNVSYWLATVCRVLHLPESERLKTARNTMHVAKTYIRVSQAYDLRTLNSPVVVFRATGGYHKADASIWRGMARGPLTIEEFDCDHEDLQWEPALVSHWAGLFKDYLDAALDRRKDRSVQ